MSKFVSRIPVDVGAFEARLPEGRTVTKVEFDPVFHHVRVYWEHDQLATCYNVPLEWDVEKPMPSEVRDLRAERGTDKTDEKVRPGAAKAGKRGRGRESN